MKILIRQAQIIDPTSPFYKQQADILIQDGVFSAIAKNIQQDADKIIELDGLSVSPGWTDIFANFCDPGYEYKETLESGAAAAAAGGYTNVMVLPNTAPVVHNKSAVEYLMHKSYQLPITLHPIAAVTKNTEGKELAEMYDMHKSGAVAFSDGLTSIQASGIVLKALQYLKAIDKVLIQIPDDNSVSAVGLMNEGIISTQLGLPGKPAIAEEIMIARDIDLNRYTGSRIHFTGISTAKSVALIKQAKEEGVQVTCSVTPHHLFFCDKDLQTYDTNLKVFPPLRTSFDRDALRKGVDEGVIDCIATHHSPHEKDSKVVEFEYSKYGMIGLETSFAIVKTAMPHLTAEKLVALFSTNPRQIFGLPSATIKENEKVCITLFNENEQWVVSNKSKSKSANTPFVGMEVKGKPIGTIHKDRLNLNV